MILLNPSDDVQLAYSTVKADQAGCRQIEIGYKNPKYDWRKGYVLEKELRKK